MGASCHHYPLLIPLSLALWVLPPPLTLSVSICVSSSVLVFASIPVFISLCTAGPIFISSLYFCLSLLLSYFSFDSIPVPDSITSLSIHMSMSLLSVNPGYNSVVKSLEDSRFE